MNKNGTIDDVYKRWLSIVQYSLMLPLRV